MKDILKIDEAEYKTEFPNKYATQKKYSFTPTEDVRAFIPGLIHDIYVKTGQIVKAGTPLISLEAMKMYNDITLNFDVVIQDITVKKSDSVEKDQILLTFKKSEKSEKAQ